MKLLSSVSLVLLAVSCGTATEGSAPANPRQTRLQAADPIGVAHAFFTASVEGDVETFESLLTAKARAGMQAGDGGFDLTGNVGSFEVGDAILAKDTAEVPVQATIEGDSQKMRLCMRHEEDAWRVYGFRVELDENNSMMIDLESMAEMFSEMESAMQVAFEESFENMRRGGSPEEIRAKHESFNSLRAVSVQEHDAAWQIDVSVKGLPAAEVLEEILSGTGLGFDASEVPETLAQPVDLELSAVSRLEAVERTCRQVGLHPVYPDISTPFAIADSLAEGVTAMVEGAVPDLASEVEFAPAGANITFEEGLRPVAFAGPFLIEVVELQEDPPHATGALTLGVRALGLDTGLLAFQSEMVETLTVGSIVDSNGESLTADDMSSFLGVPQVSGSQMVDMTTFDLRNLLRSASELSVNGSVHLTLPRSVEPLSWAADEEEPRQVGDWTVSRQEWGESTRFTLTGSEKDLAILQVRYSALDAVGQPLGVLWTDSTAWGEELNTGLSTAEAPGSVELKLCKTAELEYAFELEGVSLQRWQEQPEALATLEFNGSEPLELEFQAFTKRDENFPEIELSIFNASNKDAVEAFVNFVYLDPEGNELESFPHTLTGEFTFEGTTPLAAPGETIKQATVAHFMPPGTTDVRIEILKVTFVDASEWEAPQ